LGKNKDRRAKSVTGVKKRVDITAGLFSAHEALEPIPMQDAEVHYLRHLPLAEAPDIVMRHLIDEIPWRAENIVAWGKTYPQPRLIAWYGDARKNYTYSGILLEPLPWTQALLDIKSRVEAIASQGWSAAENVRWRTRAALNRNIVPMENFKLEG